MDLKIYYLPIILSSYSQNYVMIVALVMNPFKKEFTIF